MNPVSFSPVSSRTPVRSDLVIGGERVASVDYAAIRDPGCVRNVVGWAAQASPDDVDGAVRAASSAFPGWRDTPLDERFRLLEDAARLIENAVEWLAPVVVSETGLLPPEIRLEIAGSAFALRDTIEAAAAFLRPKTLEDAQSWVSVEKTPVGVIAAFVPWNAPIVLMVRKLAPALATGNTIVVKTPPQAPLGVGLLLAELAALFPAGVINMIHGGAEVGQALAAHPLVGRISFTGGAKAATAIMKTAAEGIKGVQFELGGNDPAIVLDDADLDRLMPTIVSGAFHRSGQFCFAIKRIYVPDVMLDRFVSRMGDELDKARIGHPNDPNTTFGPVNNENQFAYVKGLVERAKSAGYRVSQHGERLDPERWGDGYYLRPTIVAMPDAEAEIVSCEQFGPVLPVLPYRSEDEAVERANGTEYGLGSSVWTSDIRRGAAFARRLDAGMTFVNRNAQSRLGRRHMPFGGVKQSGIGTENAEYGLADYVEYHGLNYHK